MLSSLSYKIAVIILLAGTLTSSAIATYYYQQQNLKISQASDLNTQAAQLQAHINDLNSQITSLNSQMTNLNKQIDSLNSQISQLQAVNTQLGGNNQQLISQIQQLQSQAAQLRSESSQLQTQVGDLQSQLANLTSILKLQTSRTIATQVTIWGSGSPLTSSQAFINLGSITYSGYIRVSWTGAHASFTAQVFDVNITTPITTSGIFSIPVSANATANSWFTNYDCGTTISGNILCTSLTYTITYWY
jgi:chaperonin cofactor prefoldin